MTATSIRKTVLITGATSGFGKATAELLSKDGHRLVLIGRRIDRLEKLKQSLPTEVIIGKIDVTKKSEVLDFYVMLMKKVENIDVIVNSAGLALGSEPADIASLEDWETMVDTNIKGLLYVTKPAIDIMKQQGNGLIINIGSISGHMPYKGGNVYGGTKAFVRQFSNNLRTDLFGTDIKVTNIEPGMAETEFSTVRFRSKTAADDYYKGSRPLTGADIAETIRWVMTQPAHVNIDNIEIVSIDQTYGGSVINRK